MKNLCVLFVCKGVENEDSMDALEKRFRDVAGQMVRRVKEALQNPKRKEEIKQQARISVKEKLVKLRKETDAQKSEKRTEQRKKREEELT